jgi:heme oxygenase (mycobilin-producing)
MVKLVETPVWHRTRRARKGVDVNSGKGERARVVVFYRAPENDPGAIERTYHEVSAEMKATIGLVSNELMRDVMDPTSYVVLSEWADMAAFQAWDKSTGHRRTTPLDPYQDLDSSRRKSFGIFQVIAAY